MSSLLPPSASAGQRAQEAATARVGAVPVPLRALWNPATCPLALLPWLAWALSIDAWKSYWPESVKRARVAAAIAIQRRKGTAKSVRDVVAAFNADIAMREWWQTTPRGVPHTFALVLAPGAGASAAFQDDIIAEVTRTKPVRSHFTLSQGLAAVGQIGVIAVAQSAVYARLNLAEAA